MNRNSRLVIISTLIGILAALALLCFLRTSNVGATDRPTHKPPYRTEVNDLIIGVRWLPSPALNVPPQTARIIWAGAYGYNELCVFRVNETVNQFDPFNPTHETDPDADYFIGCIGSTQPGAPPIDVDGGYNIEQIDVNLRARAGDRYRLTLASVDTAGNVSYTSAFSPRLPAPVYPRIVLPLVQQ